MVSTMPVQMLTAPRIRSDIAGPHPTASAAASGVDTTVSAAACRATRWAFAARSAQTQPDRTLKASILAWSQEKPP